MIKKAFNIFNGEESSRSSRTKVNILLLVFFHAFNTLLTMALVPLGIKYLGTAKYGIWVTMSSIVLWLGYLDFGIGNGLRNKVSESLAEGNYERAKSFISTSYAIFSAGAIVVISVLLVGLRLIDWVGLLKAPPDLEDELLHTVMCVFVIFIGQLLLKLINSIINADQKSALNGLIALLSNLSTYIALYCLFSIKINSIFWFGVVTLVAPMLVLAVFSTILFRTIYRTISPAISHLDFKLSGALMNLGLQFFVIQAMGIVMFAAQNLIITQMLGPEQVTVFNVAYKYFSLILLVFGVLLTPFWSAYTEAYTKGDTAWIKRAMKKIIILWGGLSVATILMVAFSDIFYSLWIGKNIKIPFRLSAAMGLFVIISNWNNIFSYFLNGVGKIRLQFIFSILIALINIPLCVYFVKGLNFGSEGIVLAGSLASFFGCLWAPIQYLKIVNAKATGIWNK